MATKFYLLGLCLACAGLHAWAAESEASAPYLEEQVKYSNPAAEGVELAGTFTRPRGEGAVSAVLLISEAGPQDRNETIRGHKLFLTLADYLTRRGVAVLRTDDRGVGESTGDFARSTTRDFASDAEAGIRFLATRPHVDPKRIGLIGHGEGAIVAAIVAADMPEQVSFLVLLNGTAMTGEKVLLAQTARAQTAAGVPDEQIQADFRIGLALYRMVEQGRSEMDMREALTHVPPQYAPYAEAWRRQLPRLQSPWLSFFLSYDPSTALEKVKCPVLALFGEKDMTIDPEQNASAMKAAFSHGRNHKTKVKIVPGLNNLLQKADTGLSSEYEKIIETMSPAVLEDIQNWIEKEA